ncbi:MAG TPA: ABC transporter substrate-binding protein [Acidimicrobiales bacterium]|nr:ABC transporter substrate-binding protein [Acidimicrobiales bacterium]
MRNALRTAIAATVSATVATASVVVLTSSPSVAASSKGPLTVALITSQTGLAGPEYGDAAQGFLARIALQNAHGGVNGHKIVPLVINDNSNPTTVVTGVQEAISKGAIGIVSESPVFFLAAKYPQQSGIPVTGGSFDGPEWGTQPYTNMFAADSGSIDPKYPVNTVFSSFLRAHGGTTIGSYAYQISPTSVRGATYTADGFKTEGGQIGVLGTSIPFGSVAFTPEALLAKQKNVNAVFAAMDGDSNVALATAFKQAGVKTKAVVFPTGYEPSIVGTPAWSSVQGDYFVAEFRPAAVPDAATEQLTSALQKYEHRSPSNFYDYGIAEAWMGADLMMKGIQLAGSNPTSAAVVHGLRNLKSYNGAGLVAHPVNYATDFGHDPATTCLWYLQAQKKGFVPVSSQPWCGHDIPGTSVAG